jgi:hypothetical protein
MSSARGRLLPENLRGQARRASEYGRNIGFQERPPPPKIGGDSPPRAGGFRNDNMGE